MPDQKIIRTSKLGFLALKRPNLVKNWYFLPNIGIFGQFGPMPNQKTMQTRCLGGFSVMWVTKRLISPAKIRTFCPKTIKFGPKLAFCVHFGPSLAGSFGALLVGWLTVVVRAVSRKTPIYFI